MPQIDRSALVPFSAGRMFELVDDIARYPEFVPHCVAAEELERSADEVVARLSLRRAGMAQQFTTRNRLARPERISLELVEGPFRSFRGEWVFRALSEVACKVSLALEFEYAGTLGRLAGATLLSDAGDRMVDVFCARARDLHGGGA